MDVANGVVEMAFPQRRDSRGVKKQRSLQSGFPASRYATSNSTSTSTTTRSGTTPPISPSCPPRIPSLPAFNRSTPALSQQQRPATSHHARPDPSRSFTSPPLLQQSLPKRPSEASRIRALNHTHRPKSSDGRSSPDPNPGNFSRPRQPSLRRNASSPKPSLHSSATFPLESHNEEEQTPIKPREPHQRGLSASSSHSLICHSPIPLRPSTSIPDYHAAESIYSRHRNLNNSSYRPDRGMSSIESGYVSGSSKRDPMPKPIGLEGEEMRASFRSALTTNSSYLTSGTERSSVLTKSSSRTSMTGKDEGMSVDDFLGMYEDGFSDSGVEDTRPPTANSEQQRISELCEAMNDSLMVPGTKITVGDSATVLHGSIAESPLVESPSSDEAPVNLEAPDMKDNESVYFEDNPISSRPMTAAGGHDDTRDRYGFRKKTQNVTAEQYDTWNGPYSEHLARRRKKWIHLLKENGLMTLRPNRFPSRSAKVKRFIRKGIPPDWRGDAWFYYAGGPAMLSKNYGVYNNLLIRAAAGGVSETDDEIIERDLNRTFPDNVRFKPDPPSDNRDSTRSEPQVETALLQSLRRVLRAFSIYNPKIGYCQSLNFLAGLLLLFMNEEKSFWMLNIITRIYLPGTHEVNLEGANVDLGVLMMSVKETMPAVWSKIGGELDGTTFDPKVSMRLPPITLCTTAWFMSCFIGTLPIETTLRVWDCFFYEGSKTLFRIALTIFKLGETEIKAVSDPMEIFQVVQTIPRRLIDANLVLDSCYKKRGGFGNLSQAKIETRRAERRQGYAEERARANGEVTIVKRKPTVFGRRKVRVPEIS